jgi:hypothetical protein
MKNLIFVLGLVGILILAIGCEKKAQAGITSKEEVLFMEIPVVFTARPEFDRNFLKCPPGGGKINGTIHEKI